MVTVSFISRPEYDHTDYDIKVNNKVASKETQSEVRIYLANGNCICINGDGSMEYWAEKGAKIKFRGKFENDGMKVV